MRRGYVGAEFSIAVVELFTHAVVATLVLGWDSGFHYYLLLLIPISAVSDLRPPWFTSVAVVSMTLGYVGLDLWLRPATGQPSSTGSSWTFLYYFNLLSAILAILAEQCYVLIRQSRAALHVAATTDPLSFVMCDVDHFKSVNVRGGHAAG